MNSMNSIHNFLPHPYNLENDDDDDSSQEQDNQQHETVAGISINANDIDEQQSSDLRV